MKKVLFNGWNCLLQVGSYRNGRTALELIDSENGQPVAFATVNMPDHELEEDEVFIKSYSENSGIDEALMSAGVIGPAIGSVKSGFVTIYKHKLLSTESEDLLHIMEENEKHIKASDMPSHHQS